MRKAMILLAAGLMSTISLNIYTLVYLPPEKTLGQLYKILYVHVPPIWVSYALFTVALVSSAFYILRRRLKYDSIAYAAVSVGVVLTGTGILLGSIFSKKAWGAYWEWSEPRMTSTLILFMAYLGYLVLRSSVGDEIKKRSLSSVYSIMVFVTVPMSYVSVRMFRSLHPLPRLSPEMKYVLLATFLSNLVLFASIAWLYYRKNYEIDRVIVGDEVGP